MGKGLSNLIDGMKRLLLGESLTGVVVGPAPQDKQESLKIYWKDDDWKEPQIISVENARGELVRAQSPAIFRQHKDFLGRKYRTRHYKTYQSGDVFP